MAQAKVSGWASAASDGAIRGVAAGMIPCRILPSCKIRERLHLWLRGRNVPPLTPPLSTLNFLKMDRQAWIAIILSVVGLGLWQWYYVTNYSQPVPPVPIVAEATGTPAATPAAAAAATPAPAPSSPPDGPVITALNESLFTRNAEYIFSNDKGGIARADLLLHYGEKQKAISLNAHNSMPIGAVGETPGLAWGGFAMKTDPARSEAVFTKRDADGMEVTKRFVLPQDEAKSDLYVVRMELEFRNTGTAGVSRAGYFVSTGGAAPIHSSDLPTYTRFDWLHGAAKFAGIDVNWFNASSVPLLGIPLRAAQSLYEEKKPDVAWAGVASQYFCIIVSSEKTKGDAVWASRFDAGKINEMPVQGIQGGLVMPKFSLAPGAVLQESFLIYAGPKEFNRLQKLPASQDAVMNFGMFGFVSKFLLWAMNGLNGLFHSYAIAIIVLTLMIKSVLWPLQNKATDQMRKMALLSPKMTEVREKYKDDPQKLNTKMMELYKEYGVNPFSGCMPMLIQIPIFFGFYTMLGSAIELRNSQFFWIHDLSQPDTVWHIPGINFPVNLLPIIMAGTMVWQMAISPKSGDAMQQRMMMFMPIIFLVFCYNYASGLALYWTTQNLFSIVQLYLTRNKPLPTLEKKSVMAKREADAVKKKKKRPGQ